MSDMVNVHSKYWKMIGDLDRDKTELRERIKQLEKELMEVKNKHSVLVADVVLDEDRADRIKRLEEAGDGLMKSINCGCPYGPSVFNCQTCTNSWDAWRKAKEAKL